MKLDNTAMRLYAVTDRAWVGRQTLYEQVEDALRGGATCVQLREKQLDKEAFLAEARQIAFLCKARGVPFIINDDLDIALACGADGVHVGQDDMPAAEVRRRAGRDLIVGVSAHNVAEARKAAADGADYLGAGAVFTTSTKQDVTALSHAGLKAICDAVDIPVVAIGGINAQNLMELQGTGVDGVAVVSALFGAQDIEAAARSLRALSEEMTRK